MSVGKWWKRIQFAVKGRDIIVSIVLVSLLIATFFAAVAFDYRMELAEAQHTAAPIDRTIATAINCFLGLFCIGLAFAVLDKLGLLRPIESDLRELIEDLQNRNRDMFEGLAKSADDANLKIDKTLGMLRGHDRFQSAQIEFGMLGIAGVPAEPPLGDKTDYLSSIFVKELTSEKDDKTIWYMNTFMEHTETMGSIITRAVARGARVCVLVLNPNASSLMQGRYDDAYRKNPSYYESFDDFCRKVSIDAKMLLNVRQRANERAAASSNLSKGSMEVRFYEDSIGYPIVAVGQSCQAERPERIYTGFYGALSSEVMPYVEWGDGNRPFRDEFFQIFTQKWEDPKTKPDFEFKGG